MTPLSLRLSGRVQEALANPRDHDWQLTVTVTEDSRAGLRADCHAAAEEVAAGVEAAVEVARKRLQPEVERLGAALERARQEEGEARSEVARLELEVQQQADAGQFAPKLRQQRQAAAASLRELTDFAESLSGKLTAAQDAAAEAGEQARGAKLVELGENLEHQQTKAEAELLAGLASLLQRLLVVRFARRRLAAERRSREITARRAGQTPAWVAEDDSELKVGA
jgi:hypothetical protein